MTEPYAATRPDPLVTSTEMRALYTFVPRLNPELARTLPIWRNSFGARSNSVDTEVLESGTYAVMRTCAELPLNSASPRFERKFVDCSSCRICSGRSPRATPCDGET